MPMAGFKSLRHMDEFCHDADNRRGKLLVARSIVHEAFDARIISLARPGHFAQYAQGASARSRSPAPGRVARRPHRRAASPARRAFAGRYPALPAASAGPASALKVSACASVYSVSSAARAPVCSVRCRAIASRRSAMAAAIASKRENRSWHRPAGSWPPSSRFSCAPARLLP